MPWCGGLRRGRISRRPAREREGEIKRDRETNTNLVVMAGGSWGKAWAAYWACTAMRGGGRPTTRRGRGEEGGLEEEEARKALGGAVAVRPRRARTWDHVTVGWGGVGGGEQGQQVICGRAMADSAVSAARKGKRLAASISLCWFKRRQVLFTWARSETITESGKGRRCFFFPRQATSMERCLGRVGLGWVVHWIDTLPFLIFFSSSRRLRHFPDQYSVVLH